MFFWQSMATKNRQKDEESIEIHGVVITKKRHNKYIGMIWIFIKRMSNCLFSLLPFYLPSHSAHKEHYNWILICQNISLKSSERDEEKLTKKKKLKMKRRQSKNFRFHFFILASERAHFALLREKWNHKSF